MQKFSVSLPVSAMIEKQGNKFHNGENLQKGV